MVVYFVQFLSNPKESFYLVLPPPPPPKKTLQKFISRQEPRSFENSLRKLIFCVFIAFL